jgi:hypothetical protein
MSNLPEPLPQPVALSPRDNALALEDLWLRCFALGTMHTPKELEALLRGELRVTRHEYNVVAVAMNEWLSDVGVRQFVPYIEDDAPTYLNASWSKSAAIPASVSWCDQ